MSESKAGKGREVIVDLGLGALFKGFGNFLDLLAEMTEKGEAERTQSGEIRFKGTEARGVYGFSVRTGLGGKFRVEPFGNIRQTEQGPVVTEVREPLVDVFDEEDRIVVIAELPGVAEDEIRAEVRGDVLRLETVGRRQYQKELPLPSPVDAGSLTRSYNNGVLELRLKKGGGR